MAPDPADPHPSYRLLDCGDRALAVEFGREIDAGVNAAVVALDHALAALDLPGLVEAVPTYRSLLVAYDPERLPRADLVAAIARCRPGDAADPAAPRAGRRWHVPVAYGGAHGEDLVALCARLGLSREDFIALHAGRDYRVYMIGFAPGFAYLGGLPEALHASRRTDPRPATPPGTVSIGGAQTAVSPPLALPSGWQLVGRTPARSYDPARAEPFLFAAGDVIRFHPIEPDAFAGMEAAARAGEPVARAEAIAGDGAGDRTGDASR